MVGQSVGRSEEWLDWWEVDEGLNCLVSGFVLGYIIKQLLDCQHPNCYLPDRQHPDQFPDNPWFGFFSRMVRNGERLIGMSLCGAGW